MLGIPPQERWIRGASQLDRRESVIWEQHMKSVSVISSRKMGSRS